MPFTLKRTDAYTPQLFNPASFQPLGDQVLVLPDEAPPMRGMLWIPENARQEHVYYRTGVVIAVGPGDKRIFVQCCSCGLSWFQITYGGTPVRKCSDCGNDSHRVLGHSHEPMDLKPGDHILYLQRPGSEVVFEGKEYMILHEDAEFTQHVLAVLED